VYSIRSPRRFVSSKHPSPADLVCSPARQDDVPFCMFPVSVVHLSRGCRTFRRFCMYCLHREDVLYLRYIRGPRERSKSLFICYLFKDSPGWNVFVTFYVRSMSPAVSFFLREKSDVTKYLTQRQDFDKMFTAGEKLRSYRWSAFPREKTAALFFRRKSVEVRW